MRGCSPKKTDECHEAEVGGIKAVACACTKDLCNGGQTVFPSLALGVVLSSALLIWKKL